MSWQNRLFASTRWQRSGRELAIVDRWRFRTLGVGMLVLLPSAVYATCPGGLSTTVQTLRVQKTCPTNPVEADCFVDLQVAADCAMSRATASNPIRVSVHPGTYTLPTNTSLCNSNGGYISYIGSGPGNTVITGGGTLAATLGVMVFSQCTGIVVQDLTIKTGSGSVNGVAWAGGGSSTWSNVVVDASLAGSQYGWLDYGCSAATPGDHRWFASRILSSGVVAYNATCGASQLHASEVIAEGNGSGAVITAVAAKPNLFGGSEKGSVLIVGGDVRVNYSGTGAGDLVGLLAEGGGVIEAHGATISVRSSSGARNAYAIRTVSLGTVKAGGNGYDLKASGSGTTAARIHTDTRLTRLVNAPYLWPSGTALPVEVPVAALQPGYTAEDGQDLFVDTDCAAASCLSSGGNEPHLLVFNRSCLRNWFDIVTGQCLL